MRNVVVGLLASVLVIGSLSGCGIGTAKGMKGSYRRMCYEAGHLLHTAEFKACWKQMAARQDAIDAENTRQLMGAAAVVAVGVAAAEGASGDLRSGSYRDATPSTRGTLLRNEQRGMSRTCLYTTPMGQRTLTVPASQFCPPTL